MVLWLCTNVSYLNLDFLIYCMVWIVCYAIYCWFNFFVYPYYLCSCSETSLMHLWNDLCTAIENKTLKWMLPQDVLTDTHCDAPPANQQYPNNLLQPPLGSSLSVMFPPWLLPPLTPPWAFILAALLVPTWLLLLLNPPTVIAYLGIFHCHLTWLSAFCLLHVLPQSPHPPP